MARASRRRVARVFLIPRPRGSVSPVWVRRPELSAPDTQGGTASAPSASSPSGGSKTTSKNTALHHGRRNPASARPTDTARRKAPTIAVRSPNLGNSPPVLRWRYALFSQGKTRTVPRSRLPKMIQSARPCVVMSSSFGPSACVPLQALATIRSDARRRARSSPFWSTGRSSGPEPLRRTSVDPDRSEPGWRVLLPTPRPPPDHLLDRSP